MASPSPISSHIARESFSNAVDALLKWIRTQPKHQKSQLFEPDDVLYLILTLTRIPSKGRTNPYRIPIPHPIHPFDPQSTSICLIVDDRPSSPLLPAAAINQIRTRDLPISSVIGLSDLKSDYRAYESRRKLCDSYDLFFADRKILPLLPRVLGKHFFKRKKIPLAVDCSRVGWAEQIKSWCESSLLYLRTGTCVGLKIGRVTQSSGEIVDNAMVAIEGAMELVLKKWGNLRSVHLKIVGSVALPVFQVMPEMGLKIEGVWDEKRESFSKGKKRVRWEEKEWRIYDAGVFDGDDDDGGDGEVTCEEIEEVEDEELMCTGCLNSGKGEALSAILTEEEIKKKGKRVVDEEDEGERNAVEVDVVASGEAKKSKQKRKLNVDELGMKKKINKSRELNKKKVAAAASDGAKRSAKRRKTSKLSME